MISGGNAGTLTPQAALASLRAAREFEPHPLHPGPGEVERYVSRLQQADQAMRELVSDGVVVGEELSLLKGKRAQIDAAVRRQALLSGRRGASDRQGALDTLNAIFKLGLPLDRPLDGKHRGDLVMLCLFPPLDATGRTISRFWFPWLGKRFDAGSQTGLNLFTPSAKIVGRRMWPSFSDYRPYAQGILTAFDFTTYSGMGIEDPEVSTLKLDYDLPTNPRFLVKTVLDEVTQITGNYYLGKAFLRRKDGSHKLAAFFALRRWEE